MKAWKHISVVGMMLALFLIINACTQDHLMVPLPQDNVFVKKTLPLKDLSTGLAAECTPVTGDASCNAEGPGGQRLFCGADHVCYFATSDAGCSYPEFGGGAKSCAYTACTSDNECALANPDPDHLSAVCIYTVQSFKSDEGGQCAWFYKTCEVMKNTPCHAKGVEYCKDNVCTCTAVANLPAAATSELCDGIDNTCNGEVDEIFPLGQACDGTDSDQCKMGSWLCRKDGLGVECVNESKVDIVETCNGQDDDCDSATDEDFPTKGQSCDGDDADLCKNGAIVCASDHTSTVCQEIGKNVVETCNEQDDDCDGSTDEEVQKTFYWDLDGDGFGDPSAKISLACAPPEKMTADKTDCDDSAKSVHPGASEACNGIDDNCDGATDEGCDDDNDGYCDASMGFALGAACKSGDCSDEDANVNPGVEEQCTTEFDDNCDGKTDVKLDGKTPACDSCANAKKIECGKEVEIDMASEPNTSDAIAMYQCWTSAGAKTLKTIFSAPEVVIVPDAPVGTKFSLQVMTTGQGVLAARLHGGCGPEADTKGAVTAYNPTQGLSGTCAAYGTLSVGGGVVGQDFISLDAPSAKKVKVKFICVVP